MIEVEVVENAEFYERLIAFRSYRLSINEMVIGNKVYRMKGPFRHNEEDAYSRKRADQIIEKLRV